jgi:hypothetical protein
LNGLKKVISSPPKLAVFASACILIYALFISPIGMADNGDFFRVMNGNGLYKLDRSQPDEYLQYFSTDYGTYEYYNEYQSSMFSSQTLFISAATALDRLLTGNDGLFDIRFLSFFVSLWFLLGLYLLVDYATWGISKRRRYYIAALGVLFFADTGYTAYFNSFYAESIVFVSFLTVMASALLIYQKRYRPYPLLALYIFSSLVLTTAKQQNAPLGVLLGLMIIPMMFSIFKQNTEVGQRRARLRKLSVAGCSLLLCACGILVYFVIPQEFVDINKYHSMTRGILITSQNPETALDFFGINPQYSLLDGTIYYERYPAADVEGEELKTEFYPKYGFVSVAAYYTLHPSEFTEMLNTAAKNAYVTRPDAIGNYQRSAGKQPGAKTYFFTLVSTVKQGTIPRTVGFMIIWIVGMLGLSFVDKKRTLVLVCAIAMGLSQIVVSIIGAGDADLSKHIFLYNLAFDLTNFLVISTVILRWRAPKETAPEPFEIEETADELPEPVESKPDMENEK